MLLFVAGICLCKTIRVKSKHTLIIMLSAIHKEEFKIKAYDYWYDDYISKPFWAKELSLKIKSSLNRRAELAQEIYDNCNGQIDDRGIDSHIYHIRKKIKVLEEKELIKTVRGMGYIINED